MKIKQSVFILFISLALPAAVLGQGPGGGPRWRMGAEGRGCFNIEALDLSEAQRQAVQSVDARYKEPLMRRREELMVKRHELQAALRDPGAAETVIRAKSFELIALQNDIHQKMLDYQLETREILSPDQIRRWCTWVGNPFFGKQR